MAFVDNFDDMMSDTVTITPGVPDTYGAFTPSGAVLTPTCRIEGQVRLVRLATGQEVVSSVQLIFGDVLDLTVERHRYTLPARFLPRSNLKALAVEKISDESGPCYEEVYLP